MAETGKKPVTTEKPTVIVAAEINNKTVPAAAVNKPVKTENKIAADLITSPVQKKEAAVVVVAFAFGLVAFFVVVFFVTAVALLVIIDTAARATTTVAIRRRFDRLVSL